MTGLGLIFYLIPFVILYFIVRLAVRHGIDSSELGMMLKEKMKNENKS